MNGTYLIPEGTEVDSGQNKEEPNPPENRKKSKICSSKYLFIFSCLLTLSIIGGFSFLFGPLVLQRYFPLYKFIPTQINIQYYRLRLQPIDQSINLKEDYQKHDFKGRASIIFNNTQRINELRLVSEDLIIENINLSLRNKLNIINNETMIPLENLKQTGRSYHVGKVTFIPIREYQQTQGNSQDNAELRIILEQPLEINSYMLDIYYLVDSHPWGLIKSIYNDTLLKNDRLINVEKSTVVMKKAARVFPYFDNNQKIKFELSIERKTNVQGFSNVAFQEIEPIKNHTGYLWEHFKPTPKILPTSLGLIIADYKPINVTSTSPVVLKIFAPRKCHGQLGYAREVFPKVFKALGEYFEAEYSSSKLDILVLDDMAIPDLSEYSKPGLITLPTNLLLLDSLSDSKDHRWRIFSAITDAVAFQYLHDMITDDNSESIHDFVKFVAYQLESLSRNKYEDWEFWDGEEYFIENVMEKSLKTDVGGVENGRFSCIMRMLNYTFENDIFYFGISQFITSNKDLFETSKDIYLSRNTTANNYLLSWMNNPSYPVITVTRTTGWNVIISQQYNHPPLPGDFVVFLTYISQNSSKVQNVILDQPQIETNLFVPQDEWLLFNYQRRGYYRVNYQLDDWHKLIKQLERRAAAVPVINRAQLISDAFALADDGRLQFHIAIDLLNYLRDGSERNYLPWWAAIGGLNRHEAVFLDAAGDYGIFRKFKINLLKHIWSNSNQLNPKLANLLNSELCKMQFKPCIKSALDFYTTHKYRKDVLIPQWVYCTVLMHSPDEEYDYVYTRMKESVNPIEIEILLKSLTCTRVSYQLNSLLEESFKNILYAKYIWPTMAQSPMSRLLGLAFLETNIGKISEISTKSMNATVHDVWEVIIDEFLSTMSTENHLFKILQISHDIPNTLHKKLKIAMKNVNRSIQWKKEHYPIFVHELSMKSY